jgi:hypothetical protein
LLNPEDFLSRLDADRPDSDYEQSDPNTSGSSGIGSLHSEQNAAGLLAATAAGGVATLPRDGPDGEEDDDMDSDFYHEARHVMATVAPRTVINSGERRRQLLVLGGGGSGGDALLDASVSCPLTRSAYGEERTAGMRLQYAEHLNPSAKYQTGHQNLYSRSNGTYATLLTLSTTVNGL